jgi:hypothetical protein
MRPPLREVGLRLPFFQPKVNGLADKVLFPKEWREERKE